jgi:two-component system catabolic regulation response regulator CreB/two-component system response regulator ChvI
LNRRILLLDDEADVISLFKMVLEMNGFEVEAYTDPTAALSNFKSNLKKVLNYIKKRKM